MHRPTTIGAFIAAIPLAFAGAQTQDTTTRALGAVVVSATRATTTLERVPLHATVITQAEIKKSPAQTLDQLLREIPGLNLPGAPFYTTDPTGHQTRMRGVTNSKVLVLLDGVPVHDPFYTTTQWFKVPLSAVERVEVMRGGASSIWGNLAVAGVVNIITRKPIDDATQVEISRQSMRTISASASKNFMLGGSVGIRASGDVLDTDGYQTTPDAFLAALPGKGASAATNGNAQVAAYFTPAGPLSGFARVGYHRQDEDVGGYRFGQNLQTSPDASAGITADINETTRLDARAWGQYVSFDKSNGAACYLASSSNCNTTAVTAPLVQYTNSHDDNPYHEVGTSAILSFAGIPGFESVQAGADFRAVGGEDRAVTYNRPTADDASSATINRTNFGRGTQRFIGVFTQMRAAPLRRLDVTLSLRYDAWANTGGISQMTRYTNGTAGATLGGAVADSRQSSLNPSLSARFDLRDGLSLRGATYKAFRAPGLNNLYRTFSSTTSITIANPGLSPETLTGSEIGIDLRARSVTGALTAFRYDTRGLIAAYRITTAASAPAAVTAICGTSLSNCPASVNFNTNGQDATSRGIELVAAWHPAPTIDVDAGYTWTDSHYTSTTTGDPVHAQLGAVPKHLETAGLTWQVTSRWRSYANVRHSDAMYLDVNHTIAQPAFTLLNLNTSYQAARRLELYGAVTNLTDVRYADNATTSGAGQALGMPRAFTSGIRVRF